MEDRPTHRGRGAFLLQALKEKREKEKVVGQEIPEEPPKPRGRAALLMKLQQSRVRQVGASAPSTSVSVEESVSSTIKKDVETITKQVEAIHLPEKEVVKFKGETGKPLKVSANYIKLHIEKGQGVYEYEVRFNPEIDAKSQRIKLVNIIMREMGSAKVFDGGSVLYLPQKVNELNW